MTGISQMLKNWKTRLFNATSNVRHLAGIANKFITSERSEQSSSHQSYTGHLNDIQTTLTPFKKSENN